MGLPTSSGALESSIPFDAVLRLVAMSAVPGFEIRIGGFSVRNESSMAVNLRGAGMVPCPRFVAQSLEDQTDDEGQRYQRPNGPVSVFETFLGALVFVDHGGAPEDNHGELWEAYRNE